MRTMGCMTGADSATICTRSPSYKRRNTVDPQELGVHTCGHFTYDAGGYAIGRIIDSMCRRLIPTLLTVIVEIPRTWQTVLTCMEEQPSSGSLPPCGTVTVRE